jgi:1-acyl-sn-glycerol-3-phosphate acyltransferase
VQYQVKPRGWLLAYFLFSIVIVGGVVGYLMAAPLWILGFVFPPARALGGWVMTKGVTLLMDVQPWLNIDDKFALPDRAARNFITISNHRSHLDMFLLLARIPNIRVVAKSTLFKVPLLAPMMRLMRMIPLERGKLESYWEAMNGCLEAAVSGEAVHIFPEMTRCERGAAGTSEFHLAPFRVAKQAELPLVPIVFQGTDEVWPRGAAGLTFRMPVSIKTLEPLDPRDFSSAEELREEARHRIDRCLAEV